MNNSRIVIVYLIKPEFQWINWNWSLLQKNLNPQINLPWQTYLECKLLRGIGIPSRYLLQSLIGVGTSKGLIGLLCITNCTAIQMSLKGWAIQPNVIIILNFYLYTYQIWKLVMWHKYKVSMGSQTRVLEPFLPPKDASMVWNLKSECKHCGICVSNSSQYILSYTVYHWIKE